MIQALRALGRKLALLVARAVVREVRDGPLMQELRLDVLAGEDRQRVERWQQYGITSVPLAGAEALVIHVGGNRDHPAAVAVDDRRHRPTGLQPGEVVLYTDEGTRVSLLRGGRVRVEAGTAEATIESGTVQAKDGAGSEVLLSPAVCRLQHVAGGAIELLPGVSMMRDALGSLVTLAPGVASMALLNGAAVTLSPKRCDIVAEDGAFVNGQQVETA